MGPAEAEPWRSFGSIRVAERAKAVPDFVRAGRPRSRAGILHTINREQCSRNLSGPSIRKRSIHLSPVGRLMP